MAHQVLVIGGSGYVGEELCARLHSCGDQVTTLNRGAAPAGTPYSWIRADITDPVALARELDGRRFDIIHHVASLPGDTGNPAEMVQVNVLGLTHVLDWARNHGAPRVVVSSSISAYEWYPATPFSPPDYLPVDEVHPCRPRDMYSVSKRMQEELALTFWHQYQLPTVALRLTAVVGPRGKGGGRGWRAFAESLAAGQQVQIPHFTLDEECHYIDVRDVARLHIAAGEHPNAPGQIFNCCGPASTTGHQFAAAINAILPGIQIETGFPWSMAQGGRIRFSMAKAEQLLGFKPKYGIAESVASIKDWIDAGGLTTEGQRQADAEFGAGVKSGA